MQGRQQGEKGCHVRKRSGQYPGVEPEGKHTHTRRHAHTHTHILFEYNINIRKSFTLTCDDAAPYGPVQLFLLSPTLCMGEFFSASA